MEATEVLSGSVVKNNINPEQEAGKLSGRCFSATTLKGNKKDFFTAGLTISVIAPILLILLGIILHHKGATSFSGESVGNKLKDAGVVLISAGIVSIIPPIFIVQAFRHRL